MKPFIKPIRNTDRGCDKVKKYIIFMISFALFYALLQIVTGLVLVAFYTPNPMLLNTAIGQEVAFGNAETFPLFIILMIATLAYFFTQKITAARPKRAFIKK